MRPTFQLTKHPIGSLREVWAVSWPLMLGLFSQSLMFFSDRIILGHYSTAAMNASAIGGIASWACMVLPFVMAQTTEVFVGKIHGEGSLKNAARPVWQMLWLCLLLAPLSYFGSRVLAPIIFHGTGNTAFETDYFTAICDFSPCTIASFALAGFFIGTGRMKVVTYAMLFANLMNIVLDIVLVFGLLGFPEMGCKGAGFATGLSSAFQMLIYLALFFAKNNREKYGTLSFHFDRKLTWEFISVGLPSGIGRCVEVLSHMLFFRIMIMAGGYTMTCATVAQSIFILLNFMIDGLSKGATAVISNVYGANQKHFIAKILRSACTIQVALFLLLCLVLLPNIEQVAGFFFSENDQTLASNAAFLSTLKKSIFWMTLFFLFDGFCWIFFGYFTTTGDTKFVMNVNIVMNIMGYILPVYLAVGLFKSSADIAWMIVLLYNLSIFLIYFIRYQKTMGRYVQVPYQNAI